MKNNIKYIVIIMSFLIVIIGNFFLNIITKDKMISKAERRNLNQFPSITLDSILDGKFSTEFETYAMDQFVGRDIYRNIKGFTHFNILKQKDNNGLFIQDGVIYKQTGNLNENQILKATDKFNKIQNRFLKNSKVYFSIIPDKNYYLTDNELNMDYEKLNDIMKENLPNMKYVDIYHLLDKNSYYKTDIHWKQECLIDIAKIINASMWNNPILEDYEIRTKGEFYGVYAGQIGINLDMKDELKYVMTPAIENTVTYDFETNKESTVYDKQKWEKSPDKYDYYLSGATPCITMTNNLNTGKKELIIFRDSFGSSIAPLLLEEYYKITLVDIRYMSSTYLDKYIDFTNQDVLFLYSTLVLNESRILK